VFVVLTADANNILSYVTLTIVLLIVFNCPELSFRKDNFLYKHLVGFDNLNPEFVTPTIETTSQFEYRKFKDLERLGVKLKDKESIFAKYRAMKKSIAKVQIIICTICNFLEKIKNLLMWKDPQRTAYFLILIFIIFVFVSRLPIRVFILLGGIEIDFLYLVYYFICSFGQILLRQGFLQKDLYYQWSNCLKSHSLHYCQVLSRIFKSF